MTTDAVKSSKALHFLISILMQCMINKQSYIFFVCTMQRRYFIWVLRLWYVMPLSTIFKLYRGGRFYWWRKPIYQYKTTDLPQLIYIHYHTMFYRLHLVMSAIRTHNVSSDRH